MVGARIDLTAGRLPFHLKSLENLQLASKQTQKLCCIIVDTVGRTIVVRREGQMDASGWPWYPTKLEIRAGQTVTLTGSSDVECSSSVFPLNYDQFHKMCEVGDTVYVGRYLVCGAESASLYLQVTSVDFAKGEVVCIAQNEATLEGLLTVFHVERSSHELCNLQNTLPVLSDSDKLGLTEIAKTYEVDFLTLSMARSASDIKEVRVARHPYLSCD